MLVNIAPWVKKAAPAALLTLMLLVQGLLNAFIALHPALLETPEPLVQAPTAVSVRSSTLPPVFATVLEDTVLLEAVHAPSALLIRTLLRVLLQLLSPSALLVLVIRSLLLGHKLALVALLAKSRFQDPALVAHQDNNLQLINYPA